MNITWTIVSAVAGIAVLIVALFMSKHDLQPVKIILLVLSALLLSTSVALYTSNYLHYGWFVVAFAAISVWYLGAKEVLIDFFSPRSAEPKPRYARHPNPMNNQRDERVLPLAPDCVK